LNLGYYELLTNDQGEKKRIYLASSWSFPQENNRNTCTFVIDDGFMDVFYEHFIFALFRQEAE
jgi:hypothetical protein